MFVLIHSPLVGPFTWGPVAENLRQRGFEATVPSLSSPPDLQAAYWERHVKEVAQALERVPQDRSLVLVAHSGGGILLPPIAQRLPNPISASIFVDAGLPEHGKSRLALFESREAAEEFRRAAPEGLLPPWTDEDLREAIPDAGTRQRFVAELRPLPLAVYEEPIPVPERWSDVRCAYLRFGDNPVYEEAAALAQQRGWEVRKLQGNHFLMLSEPETVAASLVELAGQLNR